MEQFENGDCLQTPFPSVDGKTMLFENGTSPEQHHPAADHSTVIIQDSGPTLSGGFLVDRCDF